MHTNKTDHFLLAAAAQPPRRGASTLELAALTLAVIGAVALGGLLL